MQHEALVDFRKQILNCYSEIFQAICFVTLSMMAEKLKRNMASCNTLCNGQIALPEKVAATLAAAIAKRTTHS